MRKALKILLVLLAIPVALAALLLTALVFAPGVLLNDRTLEWARPLIPAQWENGSLRASSMSSLSKRIELKLQKVCYDDAVKICFDQLDVAIVADLSSLSLAQIGPIGGLGGDLLVRASKEEAGVAPAAKPSEPSPLGVALPSFIAHARLEPTRIELKRWQVERRGESPIAGNLDLNLGPDKEGGAGARIRAHARGSVDAQVLAAEVDLKNKEFAANLLGWEGNISLRAKRGSVDLRLSPLEEDGYRYAVSAQMKQKPGPAQASLEGIVTPSIFKGTLTARAPQVSVRNCRLEAERDARVIEGARFDGKFMIDCPVRAKISIAPSGGIDLKLPSRLGVRLRADLSTLSFPPSPSERVSGAITARLVPILTPLLEGSGQVTSILDGVPSEFPDGLRMDTDLGLALRVPQFQKLVEQLEPTGWAIWAPLRALRGRLDLELSGHFNAADGQIPVQFRTRMASKTQKLDIDANGKVEVAGWSRAPKTRAIFDIALTDVAVELPRLDLESPPRFFPDQRVHSFEDVQKQKAGIRPPESSFEYEVRVLTPANKPVRILTNLAKAPVPIALDLKMTSEQPPSGEVRVLSFPVEFFSRQATVERFIFDLRDPAEESPIDGRVKMDLTDYQVRLLLVGTTSRPVMRFESDPPLSQEQIISLLLYGRTPDELDPEESSSVGGTRAAVQDGALGLFSLLVLGSTPIQSLGYDPSTGQVQVKVRLGEGTSLNLGSSGGGEPANVGVRKRLSRRWSISTEVSNPSGTGSSDSRFSAFLEWVTRY